MADFSETALENVKTKDLGEVGDMLSSVVSELKSFDATEEEKGFFGFFKKNVDKLATMKAKYEKAEENINRIVKALEKKKEGAGSYGRPRASLPEDFREQVEYCQKNHIPLETYRRRTSLKKATFYKYVKVLQSEHEHTF